MTPSTPQSRWNSGPASPAPVLRIHEGDCWAFFAFDVGHAIDLDGAQNLLAQTVEQPSAERRSATPWAVAAYPPRPGSSPRPCAWTSPCRTRRV